MKNAMKKLMSLVLVAMILVSAVPFAASADTFALSIDVNGQQMLLTEGTSCSYADCLAAGGVDTSKVTVTNALYQYTTEEGVKEFPFGAGDVINLVADTRVYIFTQPIETEPVETKPVETEPVETEPVETIAYLNVFVNGVKKYDTIGSPASNQSISECLAVVGVKAANVEKIAVDIDGVVKYVEAEDTFALGGSGSVTNVRISAKAAEEVAPTEPTQKPSNELTDYTKFHEDVWLYIYADTTVGTVKKSLKITDGIAADGKVTLNEVKSLVRYYYNAVDADLGITFDGLYPVQGNWVADYAADKKYDTIDGLYEAAANQTVIIRVMIGNAKLANSGTADSTNPKTGDNIFMAVATMGISATVLAAAFIFTKKRAI